MRARDRLDPADLDLLDLGPDDVADDGLSGRLTLGPGLVRHDGALYGGTGLALSVLAMQAATGRDVLWATTQFVSSPTMGAELRWETEVVAEGKRTAQLLLRATGPDGLVLTALGAAGVSSHDGLTGQYRSMPQVAPPAESKPWSGPSGEMPAHSWTRKIELRDAEVLAAGDGGALPSGAMWVQRRDGKPFTPVALAFGADFVPLGVARSAGKLGAGSSLDNSLRFRPGTSTEWVLMELHGDFASGGYGHGLVYAWSSDGELLGAGSQTAAMKYLWDEGQAHRMPVSRDVPPV